MSLAWLGKANHTLMVNLCPNSATNYSETGHSCSHSMTMVAGNVLPCLNLPDSRCGLWVARWINLPLSQAEFCEQQSNRRKEK